MFESAREQLLTMHGMRDALTLRGKLNTALKCPFRKFRGGIRKKKISGPVFTNIGLLAHLLFWVALKPFLPTRGA